MGTGWLVYFDAYLHRGPLMRAFYQIPRVAASLARSPRRGHIPFETSGLEVREKDFLKVFIRRRNTINR